MEFKEYDKVRIVGNEPATVTDYMGSEAPNPLYNATGTVWQVRGNTVTVNLHNGEGTEDLLASQLELLDQGKLEKVYSINCVDEDRRGHLTVCLDGPGYGKTVFEEGRFFLDYLRDEYPTGLDYNRDFVIVQPAAFNAAIGETCRRKAMAYQTATGAVMMPRDRFFEWVNHATVARWINTLNPGYQATTKHAEKLAKGAYAPQ